MFSGVFIDDTEGEKRYAKYLVESSAGMLAIEFRQPGHEVTELAELLIEGHFDFVALDFRLDEVPIRDADGQKQKNKYRASALAQQIRDRAIESTNNDIPLILLSQENIIQDIFHADSTAEDLFDLVVSKQELVKDNTLRLAATRIASLAAAYKTIKAYLAKNKKNDLGVLLEIDSHETELVLNHQALRAIDKIKFPHQIVSKLMSLLMQRPGILLTDENLLARLAISPDSPNISQLKAELNKLGFGYSGVLHEGWPRWWWHRVEAWAKDRLGASLGSLAGTERVSRLAKVLDLALKPAESKWSHSSDEFFWVACASCDHPTELKHSVSAYDTLYQPFLEPSRICWFCIQTGAYQKRGLEVEDSDGGLAEKIESGKIQP